VKIPLVTSASSRKVAKESSKTGDGHQGAGVYMTFNVGRSISGRRGERGLTETNAVMVPPLGEHARDGGTNNTELFPGPEKVKREEKHTRTKRQRPRPTPRKKQNVHSIKNSQTTTGGGEKVEKKHAGLTICGTRRGQPFQHMSTGGTRGEFLRRHFRVGIQPMTNEVTFVTQGGHVQRNRRKGPVNLTV